MKIVFASFAAMALMISTAASPAPHAVACQERRTVQALDDSGQVTSEKRATLTSIYVLDDEARTVQLYLADERSLSNQCDQRQDDFIYGASRIYCGVSEPAGSYWELDRETGKTRAEYRMTDSIYLFEGTCGPTDMPVLTSTTRKF